MNSGEALNLIMWGVVLFILALFLIGELLDKKKKKQYGSGIRNQFGSDFKDSSGGIYYGDGFKAIGGTFSGGFHRRNK